MDSAIGRSLIDLRDALGWRIRRLVGNQLVDRIENDSVEALARCWRGLLKSPTYVGVTGSAGKTTTKELLVGMLAANGGAVGNLRSHSGMLAITRALLRLRPSHRCFVFELSGYKPDAMDEPLALLRPSVGIVTVVRDDHSSSTYPREAIAREKSKLVAALPATGTAVLNADDALVAAMAAKCAGRVITYGTAAHAELRAEDVSSVWPERLQMTLVHRDHRVALRTQLCGTHWIPSVLGAIGAGLAMGMSLEECAAGIASVVPFEGRMQPVTTSDGVTFIRDDFKAPLWTVDASFDFMKAARAKRKIIVIGMLSDVGPDNGAKYAKTATQAQDIADITVVVGAWASSVLKTRKGEHTLRVFRHVRDAAEYVNSVTRAGDLVLLKGTNKQDHLLRTIMTRTGSIACWRDDCGLESFCNACAFRSTPSSPSALSPTKLDSIAPSRAGSTVLVEPDEQVIVGLGNPDPRYTGTPHNIGHEVVDRIATSLSLNWDAADDAWIARGSSNGHRVCLLKMRAAMNDTGAGLKQLSETMAFGPEQCILVYDDLDLPLGSVRIRLNGGAGGHRGAASILEAFQSDVFRRVKVGIRQSDAKINRIDYVLTAFDPVSRPAVDVAIATAQARAFEMLENSHKAKRN